MSDLAVQLDGVGKDYRFFSLDDVHLEIPLRPHHGLHRAERRRQVHDDPHPDGARSPGPRRGRACSAIPCRPTRWPPSGTSASPRRTCGSTTRATLDWHMRFIRSIFPSLGPGLRADAAETVRPATGAEDQGPVARPARQGDAAARARAAAAAARARRADDRSRSRSPVTRCSGS